MEHVTSKVFERALASVQIPIQRFIDTGFWSEAEDPYNTSSGNLGSNQVRSVCRNVARELKRPFIICNTTLSHGQWEDDGFKPLESGSGFEKCWVRFETPKSLGGYIEVPKLKQHMVLIAPLLLAAPDCAYMSSEKTSIINRSCVSLWQFSVSDPTVWEEYYQFVLNDPDCRRARKLPPL